MHLTILFLSDVGKAPKLGFSVFVFALTEPGIEGIELSTDEQPYYTAGGDVLVHGEGKVHFEDGTTGIFSDSRFEYDELDGGDDPLEIVSNDGTVIDVNEADAVPEPAGDDLLECGTAKADCQNGVEEGGAPPASSGEDDAAAVEAAMSRAVFLQGYFSR